MACNGERVYCSTDQAMDAFKFAASKPDEACGGASAPTGSVD
jgi:hypothetical protein